MITKNDMLNMTDMQLLELVENAKGHTGKEFQAHCDTDFSYSVLLNELRNRGYENGWYKPSSTIVEPVKETEYIYLEELEAHGRCVKTSFDIGEDTLEKWRKMTSMMARKGRILEIAMIRFMDSLDSGELDFRWKK